MVEAYKTIEKIGKDQYDFLVENRLIERSSNISDSIKRNKNSLFIFPCRRSIFKEKQQIMELKKDCNLCPQLYVSCQVHGGDWIHFSQMKIERFLHQSHSLENCFPVPNHICSNVFTNILMDKKRNRMSTQLL